MLGLSVLERGDGKAVDAGAAIEGTVFRTERHNDAPAVALAAPAAVTAAPAASTADTSDEVASTDA